MSDQDQAKSDVKDFLLKEYEHNSTSMWKSEDAGETRFNWFIGVVGAVLAGLLSLAAGDHALSNPKHSLMLLIAGQSCLLVYGVLTRRRMENRNRMTDQCKRELNTIREIFKSPHFDSQKILSGYTPWRGNTRARRTGGLRETVIVINGLLVGGIVLGTLLLCTNSPITVSVGILFFVTSALAAASYAQIILSPHKPTHAGGIVVRQRGEVVEYLLVRPSSATAGAEWVFPKGHIEEMETPREAAIREVREEAGVIARVVTYVDRTRFWLKGKEIKVAFFLMRELTTVGQHEPRGQTWLQYRDALDSLTHEANKEILKHAEKLRKSIFLRHTAQVLRELRLGTSAWD